VRKKREKATLRKKNEPPILKAEAIASDQKPESKLTSAQGGPPQNLHQTDWRTLKGWRRAVDSGKRAMGQEGDLQLSEGRGEYHSPIALLENGRVARILGAQGEERKKRAIGTHPFAKWKRITRATGRGKKGVVIKKKRTQT